jgi:hypothetical protein
VIPFNRLSEAGQPARFVLVERDGAFGNAAFVPHAEADVWIVRQVSRHA